MNIYRVYYHVQIGSGGQVAMTYITARTEQEAKLKASAVYTLARDVEFDSTISADDPYALSYIKQHELNTEVSKRVVALDNAIGKDDV